MASEDVRERAREQWEMVSSESEAESEASPRVLQPQETHSLLQKFQRGFVTPRQARALVRELETPKDLIAAVVKAYRDVTTRPEKSLVIVLVVISILTPLFILWSQTLPELHVTKWDAMVAESEKWQAARESNEQHPGKWGMAFPKCKHSETVYVYTLPPEFNREMVANCAVLNPWHSICQEFLHNGLGPKASNFDTWWDILIWIVELPAKVFMSEGLRRTERHWYLTNIFFLEPIFHARLLAHPCRTSDPAKATMFYLPFYIGLSMDTVIFNGTSEEKDRLPHQFVDWLQKQPMFQRYGGVDHFMAVGRGTWDFKRKIDQDGWGSSFARWPEIKNMTRLMVQRDPWDHAEVGVPHPTFFHPTTGDEVRKWQLRVRLSPRRFLAAYVGGAEHTTDMTDITLRRILHEQCKGKWWSCNRLDCGSTWRGNPGVCDRPERVLTTFMSAHFCLNPPADQEHARAMFQCMIGGGIPVFFHHDTAYTQYKWHLPANFSSYSVWIPADKVSSGEVTIAGFLTSLSRDHVLSMRNKIIDEILPHLLYGDPWDYRLSDVKDAVDTAMDGMATRVAELKAKYKIVT